MSLPRRSDSAYRHRAYRYLGLPFFALDSTLLDGVVPRLV